nr:hypothetical protein [Gemmatimonadota bacterium]
AYEGVAMGKPVILNDERITKGYFSSGALYTNSSVTDLEQQFLFAAERREELTAEVRLFFRSSAIAWGAMLDNLNRTIHSLRS